MKTTSKRYFPGLLVIALFVISSCKKDLNQIPISNSTTITFYKTQSDFTQALTAIYNDLRTFPNRMLNLSETRSDNLYAASDGGVRDWEGINGFASTLNNNPYIVEAYKTDFNGIYRVNEFLSQMETNGSIISNPALRTQYEAEAKFLRAFYYFDLVRWFGKVPLVDKVLTAKDAETIGRSPVADIYKFIIADLEFAKSNLPLNQTDKGRATLNAAKGILALVYMTRSGPTYGIEGPGLGTNDWQTANTLLGEIIASNKYSAVATFTSIFSYSNENSTEVVFDIQYLSGGIGVGANFVWLLTPDGYFQSFGLPTQGALFIRPVSQNFLNSFAAEPGDIRRAATITNSYVSNGVTESRPFYTKYVDVTKYGKDAADWPINYIVMRYTDVLLMKAECILHGATGSQGDVDAAVNLVRARAGLTPVSGVTMASLMEERRKEFAAEGLRWHDLVRSGLVTTIMPAWIAADDVQHRISPFQPNYIIYPIPLSELTTLPGLYTQNPGY
ncbi:RagB/SusD family nutrient uptake outer membrane protein [Sphingobacteriaceae bacterium]|nr:RagB/SusD family nutrient uptake outer membrane protein [Sphingobacteriaceae bacterium]